MPDDTKEVLRRRVRQAEAFYRGRGRIVRVLWSLIAVTVLLLGLAMTVLPGPAIVVIPVGLGMLAAQFSWARRLADAAIEHGVDTSRRLKRLKRSRTLLGLAAVACAVAAVVAFLVLR